MLKDRYQINPDYISNTDRKGDTYFANISDSSSSVLRLRGPSSLMWNLLKEEKNKKQITDEISKVYEVGNKTIHKDLKFLIDNLVEHEILIEL